MNKTTKKQTKNADYSILQEELETRYGPAMAQEIIDQVKKTEKTNEMPDYMNFHAMSEILENLRQETQKSLKSLKLLRKTGQTQKQGRGVINFEETKSTAKLKKLFTVCTVQQWPHM